MTHPRRDPFGGQLRRLEATAFARFVAALWAAMGWTTTRRGRRVVARRAGGERVTLLAAGGFRWLPLLVRGRPDDVDRVVTPLSGPLLSLLERRLDGAVGAAGLYERVRYGVADDAERAALLDEHFPDERAAPLDEHLPDRDRSRSSNPSSDDRPPIPAGSRAMAGLVVLLVAGFAVGGVVPGPTLDAGAPVGPPGIVPDAGGAVTGAGPADEAHDPATDAGAASATGASDARLPRGPRQGDVAPAPRPAKSCADSPREAVLRRLAALRNASLASKHRPGLHPEFAAGGDSPDSGTARFIAELQAAGFRPLASAAEITVGEPERTGDRAVVPVTVADSEGRRTYAFALERVHGVSGGVCWAFRDVREAGRGG